MEPDLAGAAGPPRRAWPTWILPLARVVRVGRASTGSSTSSGLDGPVVFAANHQSHMDVPVILAALPGAVARRASRRRWPRSSSRRTSSRSSTSRGAWFTNSLNYYLAAFFFNAFPLPQREAGARQTLRYIGELTGDGYSVLIFPEGVRSRHRRDQAVPRRHRR